MRYTPRRRLLTIADAHARALRSALLHTPFGVLTAIQTQHLLRATARDAGVTVAEVVSELEAANG